MYEPALNDLLAGVIDLAPAGTAPHPPGPCADLCVPGCTASEEPVVPRTTSEEVAAS